MVFPILCSNCGVAERIGGTGGVEGGYVLTPTQSFREDEARTRLDPLRTPPWFLGNITFTWSWRGMCFYSRIREAHQRKKKKGEARAACGAYMESAAQPSPTLYSRQKITKQAGRGGGDGGLHTRTHP